MGGQCTDTEYKTEAHTFYTSASANVMPRLDLSAMFSYTMGTGDMEGLSFASDPFIVGVAGRTDDYSFTYVNGSDAYSDLDYTMLELELSAGYSITDSLGLTVSYWYSKFQDDGEYVYGDLDGNAYTLMGYVTYRF